MVDVKKHPAPANPQNIKLRLRPCYSARLSSLDNSAGAIEHTQIKRKKKKKKQGTVLAPFFFYIINFFFPSFFFCFFFFFFSFSEVRCQRLIQHSTIEQTIRLRTWILLVWPPTPVQAFHHPGKNGTSAFMRGRGYCWG